MDLYEEVFVKGIGALAFGVATLVWTAAAAARSRARTADAEARRARLPPLAPYQHVTAEDMAMVDTLKALYRATDK